MVGFLFFDRFVVPMVAAVGDMAAEERVGLRSVLGFSGVKS